MRSGIFRARSSSTSTRSPITAIPCPTCCRSPRNSRAWRAQLGLGDGRTGRRLRHRRHRLRAARLVDAARLWATTTSPCSMAACRNGSPRAGPVTDRCAAAKPERRFTPQFRRGRCVRDQGGSCSPISTSKREQVRRCALRRPLRRHRAGAAAGPARRPHPGRRQPALGASWRSQDAARCCRPKRLEARLALAGLAPGQAVVDELRLGRHAPASSPSRIHLVGWQPAAVYDGSWSEWGMGNTDTPVATGP